VAPIGVGAGVDSSGGGVVGLSSGGDVFGSGGGAEPVYDSERVRAQHPHRQLAAVAAGVGGGGGSGKAALDGLGGGEEAPELRRRKYPGGRQGESTRGREREKEEKVEGVWERVSERERERERSREREREGRREGGRVRRGAGGEIYERTHAGRHDGSETVQAEGRLLMRGLRERERRRMRRDLQKGRGSRRGRRARWRKGR
jgi:hypothetical protein